MHEGYCVNLDSGSTAFNEFLGLVCSFYLRAPNFVYIGKAGTGKPVRSPCDVHLHDYLFPSASSQFQWMYQIDITDSEDVGFF